MKIALYCRVDGQGFGFAEWTDRASIRRLFVLDPKSMRILFTPVC